MASPYSETMYFTDLRIREVVKIFVSYDIACSRPFSLNDFEFIVYCVTSYGRGYEKRNKKNNNNNNKKTSRL